MTDRLKFATFLVFGGAAALAVGAFLPWMKATVPFAGTVTASGVDNGGDGIFLVGAAFLVTGLCWWLTRPGARWWVALAVLLCALGAAFVLAFDVNDLRDRFSEVNAGTDLISTSYGAGLYLCGFGTALVFGGGMLAMFETA